MSSTYMPTPGSKVCSASGWPMPRMNTLTLLAEPRPCTMLRLGTAPCRPVTSLACRLARSSSPKALTATGTSWIDSVRRRAVTVTASSVRASAGACAPASADAACSCTGTSGAAGASACCAHAAGDSRTQPIARLKCLRFIRFFSPLDACRAACAAGWPQGYGGHRAGGIVPSDNGPAATPATTLSARWMHGPRVAHRTRAGESGMAFLIVLAALCFLMFVAYRGHSGILFAPIAALGAVLLTDPSLVAPMFTGLFMDNMFGFLKQYFPVFLVGAVFGKLIEISGFSKAIVAATIRIVGAQRAMLSIVLVCAL